MGRPSCNCPAPKPDPYRNLEVESKVWLKEPMDLGLAVVTSKHLCLYDEADNYLCSVTNGTHLKTKTQELEAFVGGVPVLVRREVIRPWNGIYPKETFRCREFTRERMELRERGVQVAYDVVTAGDTALYQLEIEAQDVSEPLSAMRLVAEVMSERLGDRVLRHDLQLEKYEAIKPYATAKSVQLRIEGLLYRLAGI